MQRASTKYRWKVEWNLLEKTLVRMRSQSVGRWDSVEEEADNAGDESDWRVWTGWKVEKEAEERIEVVGGEEFTLEKKQLRRLRLRAGLRGLGMIHRLAELDSAAAQQKGKMISKK